METSTHLAQIIGLFGTLSTLSIMIKYKLYLAMEADAAKNSSTIYLSGFLFLLLGILIVVSHQVWTPDWRIIITLLGWLVLLKGFMRILAHDKVKAMLIKKQSEKRFIYGEIATFLLSLFLVYKGFTK